jgi:hypothetical protein
MNEEQALEMAMGVIERVMATQHPGRPAFYALTHARREIKSAQLDIRTRTRGIAERDALPGA